MEKVVVSHADAAHHLCRMGYPPATIQDLLGDLPDPIDTERDADALFRLGPSASQLMDRMGGSP